MVQSCSARRKFSPKGAHGRKCHLSHLHCMQCDSRHAWEAWNEPTSAPTTRQQQAPIGMEKHNRLWLKDLGAQKVFLPFPLQYRFEAAWNSGTVNLFRANLNITTRSRKCHLSSICIACNAILGVQGVPGPFRASTSKETASYEQIYCEYMVRLSSVRINGCTVVLAFV